VNDNINRYDYIQKIVIVVVYE